MTCTLLYVWADTDFTSGFEEKIRGKVELEYLYYANCLALHIMEALEDIVEKGSFHAVMDSKEKPKIIKTMIESPLEPKIDVEKLANKVPENYNYSKKETPSEELKQKFYFLVLR